APPHSLDRLVSRHLFNGRTSISSAFTVILLPDAPPNWSVAPLALVVVVSTTWFTLSPVSETAPPSNTRNSATGLPATFRRTNYRTGVLFSSANTATADARRSVVVTTL